MDYRIVPECPFEQLKVSLFFKNVTIFLAEKMVTFFQKLLFCIMTRPHMRELYASAMRLALTEA